jgi:CspA family cold shock protein
VSDESGNSSSSGEDRLEGEVKFFNFQKGYGFIEVDDDDYFVHVTNVEESDLLLSDERVTFKPVEGHKGLQALKVRREDAPNMEQDTGFIKEFHDEEGFGFIDREGKADVFVHLTDIMNAETSDEVSEGDEVSFDIRSGRDGRDRAYRVQVDED